MILNIFHYLNFIKILVLITFFLSIFNLNLKSIIHIYIVSILSVCLITEIMIPIFIHKKLTSGLFTTISVIFHHSLWILILLKSSINKKNKILLILFTIFAVFNLFYIEGNKTFNYYTFVIGAIIYITLFTYLSFMQLKIENFAFFQSNNYILLCAPLLFLFGLSFMFSFKNSSVTSEIIFFKIKLYTIITYFVNIIYYTLINIYIYKEYKLKNAI